MTAPSTWSRVAGLWRVRNAVERAKKLGAGATHNRDGSPCCALGHGIGQYDPYVFMWPFRAAAILGIDTTDANAISHANDSSRPEHRKARVLACIDERLVLAKAGRT